MEYQGIDLAHRVGWYVVCQGRKCGNRPTIFGRIIRNQQGDYALLRAGQVIPSRDGRPIQLTRLRKPRTAERVRARVLPGGWAGGFVGDGMAHETEASLTWRLVCPNPRCGRVISLAHLAQDDLRRY